MSRSLSWAAKGGMVMSRAIGRDGLHFIRSAQGGSEC
jgi:uncharacterized protein YbjQ (UPF0145 family)